MRVNLDGVFNGVHAFLPHILAHGEGGQIITTSSVRGLFVVGEGYGAYCTSKFAVVGMTEVLRAELADSNIGASVFCPGLVRSNIEKLVKDSPLAAELYRVWQLVLRGLRNNDLYILTHPEFKPFMQRRHEALMAWIANDLMPTEARMSLVKKLLQGSICKMTDCTFNSSYQGVYLEHIAFHSNPTMQTLRACRWRGWNMSSRMPVPHQ